MIDDNKRQLKEQLKNRIRNRINTKIDYENYEFIPEKEKTDFYNPDTTLSIGVYVRVSTENLGQISSYELQKKYYEDYVRSRPMWKLHLIYADEGLSGTSLKKRDAFNRMMDDCKAGLIDMIITKSVSRFSRNVLDCVGTVRMLSELKKPIGVFFESEALFSLEEESQITLTLKSSIAQEESHIRSRSMETSLRMRLDGGLPLTPKLLGYSHDVEGNLIINHDEAPTVKLIFYMYLYGYSTAEIAEKLTQRGLRTYLGNTEWSSSSIYQVLRNERHCGDVLTRKTYTQSFLTHRTLKNRGNKPQSIYRAHHEAIISREDFIAVQHLLNNAKYKNKSILPELRVIDSGILKGYVTINPRWAGFTAENYYAAADAIDSDVEQMSFNVLAGDFDLRGFEITRCEMFDTKERTYVTLQERTVKFNTVCVRKFGANNRLELLINPKNRTLAVRIAAEDNRHSVLCSKPVDGIYYPRDIAATAFIKTLYRLFGWNDEFKYRMAGTLFQRDNEFVYVFSADNAEAFFTAETYLGDNISFEEMKPLSTLGKKMRAVPSDWVSSFGSGYYEQRHSGFHDSDDPKIGHKGFRSEVVERFNITDYDTIKQYIEEELKELKEVEDFG